MDIDTQTHNRALFLAWLRTNFPDLYADATKSAGLGGFFDSLTSAFNNVVTNVSNALPNLANTYAQYRQQEQLIRLNSQRANQGLPPLIQNAQGQWVDMAGQAYDDSDWELASTGGLSTGSMLMIAVAVGLTLVLIFKR